MTNSGLVTSTTHLDKFLYFDAESGSLDVTLGGAIACNVHGKDGHYNGTFSEQV